MPQSDIHLLTISIAEPQHIVRAQNIMNTIYSAALHDPWISSTALFKCSTELILKEPASTYIIIVYFCQNILFSLLANQIMLSLNKYLNVIGHKTLKYIFIFDNLITNY